ncbi:MAG: peptidoglycan-associated lipoprotein Pal [Candidatus Competibacteraceae bacterium]|nr:peptidoglycan-associated lipoprotein Pal [Candidatus Competibacteraceae bacterium]MBK7984831.1 peptidoglycan-associated lipoprotein Pal [Candidatus Competibacteraceae bacterium]MBK8899406.1 peptidoglycan-associated lipoprotein Pal [Candidatus Competibacteraceae bacterium]MBK8964411.1 peptidoglycan-associated lipoprotein Pal [Candidatus Competibacteraceae bacterium]MBK9952399.1 peptidoglycan-associated lipoprotein Pal [Candidatus Competibacteraceae bacterium]
MQYFIKTLIAAASLALLASCASTGENTEETTDATATQLPDGTGQAAGQEAYSYPYGQSPSGYDTFDTSGGESAAGGKAGGRRAGRGGGAGGNVVSADRIVYFEYDSANIRAESRPVIEANARALSGNRRGVTQLEGHTDERGSREYNIALGERRANAVRQAMTAMGVSPQQIRVVSYGEERPAAAGQDEQSYALNRRVEIVY